AATPAERKPHERPGPPLKRLHCHSSSGCASPRSDLLESNGRQGHKSSLFANRQMSKKFVRRRWVIGGTVALLAILVIGAAISWHFSSAVLVPDHSDWPEKATVERLDRGSITLSRDEETQRPGVYGLNWRAGHAVIGAVTAETDDTVTRRLHAV